jgi:hypothetical protein
MGNCLFRNEEKILDLLTILDEQNIKIKELEDTIKACASEIDDIYHELNIRTLNIEKRMDLASKLIRNDDSN